MCATLCCHAGSQKINFDELKALNSIKPEVDASYTPVEYSQIVVLFETFMRQLGYEIQSEQFAVSTNRYTKKIDGAKFFGLIEAKHKDFVNKDFIPAIGIRSSWDKSIAPQSIAGGSIFICDNLAFSGDVITMNRRQTAHINLPQEIFNAVNKTHEYLFKFMQNVDLMKKSKIALNDAKAIILDSICADLFPTTIAPDILAEYNQPSFAFDAKEVKGTVYGIHNAFTHSAKSLREEQRYKTLVGVNAICEPYMKKNDFYLQHMNAYGN